MWLTRRHVMQMLAGGGLAIGLRSLVTGIPAGLIASPAQAIEQGVGRLATKQPQFVIYSTSLAGDPVNANVPGTYEDPAVVHAKHASMVATDITQQGVTRKGAQIWSTLPQGMLDNTVFFHHATGTLVHNEQSKVMRLMGAVNHNDMLVSMLAANLAGPLGTITHQPISLFTDPASSVIADGVPLAQYSPSSLKSILGPVQGILGDKKMSDVRDKTLDALNAWGKNRAAGFQRDFIDKFAISHAQSRAMQEGLGQTLSSINDDGVDSQIAVALVLFALGLTPAAAVSIYFGGDNHYDGSGDSALTNYEVPAHSTGTATLSKMYAAINASPVKNRVSFILSNVFGRTLAASAGSVNGRSHNNNHAVAVMYSPNLKGGVVGGIYRPGVSSDFAATAINPTTGASTTTGGIDPSATLGSMGKTFTAAMGIADDVVTSSFRQGSVVTAALQS